MQSCEYCFKLDEFIKNLEKNYNKVKRRRININNQFCCCGYLNPDFGLEYRNFRTRKHKNLAQPPNIKAY